MKTSILLASLVFAVEAASADTLDLALYRIEVVKHCDEHDVVCDNVSYVGTNKKTGKSITLRGRTLHSLCADGVTPCHFQGYEFKNGATRYLVMADGDFSILRGKKVVLNERGAWQ